MKRNLCLGLALLAVQGGMTATQTGKAGTADLPLLEEVIVTARKRAQNLQDVPVSALVMNRAGLDRTDIDSITDQHQPRRAGAGPERASAAIDAFAAGAGRGDMAVKD